MSLMGAKCFDVESHGYLDTGLGCRRWIKLGGVVQMGGPGSVGQGALLAGGEERSTSEIGSYRLGHLMNSH